MPDVGNISSEDRVQWIYASTTNEQLAERYDEWAKEYDDDLENTFVWLAPVRGAEALASRVAKDAKILDAGAGTGLAGVELQRLGYSDICAMDLSEGMLEEARAKGCYNDFQQMALGGPLDFDTDTYDAVISTGVFTPGHAPPSSFVDLCRVTKPGGYIVFSLRPDTHLELGFKEQQDALVDSGAWSLVEVSDPFAALPKGEPDVMHQIWVYRVN
ncbi:MAG: class I SAM-dependent methyltransferase [Chloroflexi bacterium]|nr:class I SAM-dependent methyltransferase [Chloroflexota bacterium]MYD48434.1 class I SAM-dependent methyltransferase [Chloroflexota bacterium]